MPVSKTSDLRREVRMISPLDIVIYNNLELHLGLAADYYIYDVWQFTILWLTYLVL
jgi:hypothetical protein